MPFDLFWWEGLDGSRVLAHTFKNPAGGYNSKTDLVAVIETWRNFAGKHLNPESLLCLRPWRRRRRADRGDAGRASASFADFPVVPALRPVNVADWFASTRDSVAPNPELPIWVGEIYLELHRGTLTTQGRTKFLHRRAERALITAETVSAWRRSWVSRSRRRSRTHWRVLLRNQFHDILPGSSIREVYEQTEAELAGVDRRRRHGCRRPALGHRREARDLGRRTWRAGRQSRSVGATLAAGDRSCIPGWPGGRGRQRACRRRDLCPASRLMIVEDASPPAGLSVDARGSRTPCCGST